MRFITEVLGGMVARVAGVPTPVAVRRVDHSSRSIGGDQHGVKNAPRQLTGTALSTEMGATQCHDTPRDHHVR